MEINSTDYHDFVFQGGKLVGEFEQMYAKAGEIPWHQDEQRTWVDVRLTLELLRSRRPFGRIIDYGAGLGYYLDILVRELGVSDGQGIDVSDTAIHKARGLFPDYGFQQADIGDESDSLFSSESKAGDAATLHVIRGTLWYVFPVLESVVRNLSARLNEVDSLLVVQNFPPLQSDFIGKDVIPNPDALVAQFCAASLRLEESLWYDKQTENSNDSWFIGIFSKQA